MRIHVLQTGYNLKNKSLKNTQWTSFLNTGKPCEFPIFSFVVEHPEGLFMIDTGLTTRARVPRWQQWLAGVPSPQIEPGEEINLKLFAKGLRPGDVQKVILTHLDWDAAGGIRHFPDAQIMVHRKEYNAASTLYGKIRYQPRLWPSWFDPVIYDFDPEPFGPFPVSKTLTKSRDLRIVPIPGHTVGQVGVILETQGAYLFFCADHILRQDWFIEDYRAGNLHGFAYYPEYAPETSRRIMQFAEDRPTVLLPSHDAETPDRLKNMEILKV